MPRLMKLSDTALTTTEPSLEGSKTIFQATPRYRTRKQKRLVAHFLGVFSMPNLQFVITEIHSLQLFTVCFYACKILHFSWDKHINRFVA